MKFVNWAKRNTQNVGIVALIGMVAGIYLFTRGHVPESITKYFEVS